MLRDTLDYFADLLTYPRDEYAVLVRTAHTQITAVDPTIGAYLDPLAQFVADAPQGDTEELFTRTFDMNPPRALELGWHLYGEDYDRGAFLVTVRDLMRRHGVEETGELPDHATHILRLLSRLEDDEAQRFARKQAMPAFDRILLNFKDTEHPYRVLLAGVRQALGAHFGVADKVAASAFACAAPYEDAPDAPLLCSGMGQSPCSAPPTADDTKPMEM